MMDKITIKLTLYFFCIAWFLTNFLLINIHPTPINSPIIESIRYVVDDSCEYSLI
jgi:hypothetical protein